jgi:thioredoxin-like negative regulator of GroEL
MGDKGKIVQVEAAEANLPEQENGLYLAKSSEQVDALVKVNTDKVVILLAGLSWCRPCMSLTRPLQKLARHYEGAVFAKILGDHSDNTKIFFKDVLKVCLHPIQTDCR